LVGGIPRVRDAGPSIRVALATRVTVPHTWNAQDGQDGGGNYYRGIGWYRRHLTLDSSLSGKELFIKFDAASIVADLYINGTSVGEHQGAFAAFTFDVTPYLKVGQDNVIAVGRFSEQGRYLGQMIDVRLGLLALASLRHVLAGGIVGGLRQKHQIVTHAPFCDAPSVLSRRARRPILG